MSQRRPTRGGWEGGRRRPTLGQKKRVRTPLPGGPLVESPDDRKSGTGKEGVLNRPTSDPLLSAPRRSYRAHCSETPVCTMGSSPYVNTPTFQYPKYAPRSQNGLGRGVPPARGSLIGPAGGVWGCSDIPAPPNTWGMGWRGGGGQFWSVNREHGRLFRAALLSKVQKSSKVWIGQTRVLRRAPSATLPSQPRRCKSVGCSVTPACTTGCGPYVNTPTSKNTEIACRSHDRF